MNIACVVLLTVAANLGFGFNTSEGAELDFNASTQNWAGYAVTGAAPSHGYTSVSGSWIVPALTPTSANSFSGIWVGLDGFNSNTVEQIGITANYFVHFNKFSYSAFYELYPSVSVIIDFAESSQFTVSPGDSMFGQVHYNGAEGAGDSYTLTLTNITTQLTFSTTVATSTVAARSSAEWIVEAPVIAGSVGSLANFGSVTFTGASATLDGITTNTIAGFNNTGIDLLATSGLNAIASALGPSGDTFTVTVVPEPSAIVILSLLGFAARRRRTV